MPLYTKPEYLMKLPQNVIALYFKALRRLVRIEQYANKLNKQMNDKNIRRI
jgi:hypothetical protein